MNNNYPEKIYIVESGNSIPSERFTTVNYKEGLLEYVRGDIFFKLEKELNSLKQTNFEINKGDS